MILKDNSVRKTFSQLFDPLKYEMNFTFSRLAPIFISSPNILKIMNISGIFLIFPLKSWTVFVHLIFKYSLYARQRAWNYYI